MNPLISVILPVYNQEHYIAETIESVLAQTYKDFEFLILDDGSKDRSAEIIRQYAEKDSRIKAFFEPNAGKSNGTNRLVSLASGKWCAFLDADDIMLTDRLEKQIEFHNDNPEADASSSHCYYINEKGNMFGTQKYPHLRTPDECRASRIAHEYITCSFTALMVSKKAFQHVGGLDKRFEPCEDFEFFNRLMDNRYIVLINPIVSMKYRIHPTAVTVKKPMLVFDTITYVKQCLQLRRAGKPELSFKDFMTIQKGYSWWVKFNRKRFNYARIFFRNAGFAMLSKDYLNFAWQIVTSLVLSPHYFLKKVNNFAQK